MSGDVPEGWALARLAAVVRIATDGVTVEDLAKIPEVYHYSLPAFDAWGQPEIGLGASIKSNKTVVPPDCVLFSKLNPRIPRIWRVRKSASVHSYCSTEFWPLVRKSDQIDLDFLAQLLGSERFLGDPAIAPSSSTNSHQRVDRKSFEGFHLLLPPLDEQRRIAEVLRSVDETVRATDASLDAAAALRSSVVEGLLEGWQEFGLTPLKEVILQMDSGWSPECDGERAEDGEWAVLKTSSVTWGGYGEGENKRLPASLAPRREAEVRVGDILVTRAGQAYRTGVVAFVSSTVGKRMVSDKIVRLRARVELIRPRLLAAILSGKSVQSQMNPLKSGLTTLTNITQKMISGVLLPVPPVALQEVANDCLEALDEVIGRGREEVIRLESLKSQLADDLLSGRVRVPV